MTTIRTRSIAALGAIVATFATVSMAAPARAETAAVAVPYGDLDLATPAGVARLRHRIRAAADAVCGPQDALFRARIARCRSEAIARAEASIPGTARPTLIAQR